MVAYNSVASRGSLLAEQACLVIHLVLSRYRKPRSFSQFRDGAHGPVVHERLEFNDSMARLFTKDWSSMIHLLLLMLGLHHYTVKGKKTNIHAHPHGGGRKKTFDDGITKVSPRRSAGKRAPTVWEAQATTKAPKSLGKPGSLREQAERANRAYLVRLNQGGLVSSPAAVKNATREKASTRAFFASQYVAGRKVKR